MVMTGAPSAEFGTGLLRTTIRGTPQGWVWSRRPGPDAPAPFADPYPPLTRWLLGRSVGGVRWVVGERDGQGGRIYTAPSALSAALLLLGPGPRQPALAALADALAGVGGLLAELHGVPTPLRSAATGPPRALLRLHNWLTGVSSTPGRAALRTAVGVRRYRLLTDTCAAALAPSADHVLSHGALSLGSLVLGPGNGAAVFVGEDLGIAPRAFDLAWPVGELSEFGLKPEALRTLVDALSQGYGEATPLDGVWPALRVAVHTHDTIAYRPWPVGRAVACFGPLLRQLLKTSRPSPGAHAGHGDASRSGHAARREPECA